MSENTVQIRLSKFAREYNLGIGTIVDFLQKKGIKIDNNPNTKIPSDAYELLLKEFQKEKLVKEEASKIILEADTKKSISIENNIEEKTKEEPAITEDNSEVIIKSQKFDKPDIKTPSDKPVEEPIKPVEAVKPIEPIEKNTEDSAPINVKIEKKSNDVELHETEIEKHKVLESYEITTEDIIEPVLDIKEEIETTETTEIIETIEDVPSEEIQSEIVEVKTEQSGIKVVGKIDLSSINLKTKPAKKTKEEKEIEKKNKKQDQDALKQKNREDQAAKRQTELETTNKTQEESTVEKTIPQKQEEVKKEPYKFDKTKLSGPIIIGKMRIEDKKEQKPADNTSEGEKKKKRKRIFKDAPTFETDSKGGIQFNKGKQQPKNEISEDEIQKQIKETLARLSSPTKSKGAKHRRQKRETERQHQQEMFEQNEEKKNIIQVTEFVTASELAQLMQVQVTEIISMCLNLGLFVSINQRLDAETISIVTEELGYKVEFVSVDLQENLEQEEEDTEENLLDRAPIVTVMGHVDHGKTKLLDFIRKSNVVSGEAGGITQHIGAYEVSLEGGRRIVFLDTPGHEAFTAMRARGAKVTDIAIIIIAADDGVKPQTVEAINHAQAAGVPIIIAINKIDKPTANPEKIKEQLANLNILVEDWGGKYLCQHIAAKEGINIDKLLEKIVFEADMLELKANPKRRALGTVIESSLDKGRGYVSKVLVQNGTLRIGDSLVAGCHFGKIKAMYNERNVPLTEAGPSTPALILGLTGAPQAGDTFNVIKDEKDAKNIAQKRQQLMREQGLRTQKHITLDEIGRRIAIGDFKELNLIIKGDVDGSIEALADSLIKLSTEEVQVNVIHKSVGSITESDVTLASASNAIIIGFQVRPTVNAKKIAESEQIDIRLYSIIYNAINEIKSAIEGMLSPDIEEKILCNIEIREVFRITKVGAVAGCMVLDGKINRNTKIRVIRDGIVIYTGMLGSLKRFKDDVKEVTSGYECGLNVQSFNDIQVGDIIEGYEQIEIKRTL